MYEQQQTAMESILNLWTKVKFPFEDIVQNRVLKKVMGKLIRGFYRIIVCYKKLNLLQHWHI